MAGSTGQTDVDVNDATAVEFDSNAEVGDDEFPTMAEAVMLSRGIRTSVDKSQIGLLSSSEC